ncbi:DnaB-like helicase C-terminal domain-containing protein [Lacticaseibacillus jixiensis]|uniref:DnaB-like helicase C-terminal domain-containing protein n=1 Tax=Lacticaseibacillus jixiensis TaxID=3231926 RepID=UPI0036F23D7B
MNYSPDDPRWHVLYCITQKPALVRTEWIDPDWMSEKHLSTLVSYVNEQGKAADIGYIELRTRLDEDHPNLLSRDVWDCINHGGAVLSELHQWNQMLKRKYYRGNIQRKAVSYAKDPSNNRLDDLLDAVKLSEAATAEDDRGADMKTLATDMDYRLEHHVDDGIKTYQQIDEVFGGGLKAGRLITLGARPSVGKSAFVVNLILKAFEKQSDMTIDLFSLEMTQRQNYDRLISAYLGLPGKLLNNPDMLTDKQKNDVRTAGKIFNGYDLHIYDNLNELHQIVNAIVQSRADAEKSGKKYLAIIDYLQLVEVPRQSDRRLQIEQITRQFKKLTQSLNIPVIMLSQLSRMMEKDNRQRPRLSDLRESGSIEQDSNAVGFLYNEDEKQEYEKIRSVILSIQKNREGERKDIPMTFQADKMRFGVTYG